MIRTRWSSIFLEHSQEVLLFFWFQEGGILRVTRNTKETNPYACDGDTTFDYEDPVYGLASLKVMFLSYHLQPA